MPPKSGSLSADYKVPGGKLLRVHVDVEEEEGLTMIRGVKITGDFFMHPEDAIEDLESRLAGTPLTDEAVRAELEAFFNQDVEVIGADVEDLVVVLMAAK